MRHARRLRPSLISALAVVCTLSLSGCATTGDRGQPLVPTRFQTRSGPFVVFTNDPIPADSTVVRRLQALETEFQTTLKVDLGKVEPPIEVYILADRKSFEHFLTFYYPELPQRRAFFLAQGDRRVIYAYQSERLEVDLRHEATHALLSASFGDLPLWVDEGLAEYFECPGESGNNPENLGRLPGDLAEGWKPDLPRLEKLRLVKEMTPRDYRESWAWVHLMLNGPVEERAKFVDSLTRVGRKPSGDSVVLASLLEESKPEGPPRLLAHLKTLLATPIVRAVPATNPNADRVIRLQGPGPEPLVRSSKPKARKGIFAKVREWFAGESESADL